MEEEELKRLRQRRLAEMQQRQQAQDMQQADQADYQQQAEFEAKKEMLIAQILSSDARSRLTNIRMTRPQYAETLEMQLIQALQNGALKGQIPLSDEQFKNILMKLNERTPQKRESNINSKIFS